MLEAVPILRTKDIPTTLLCATMAGLCGLIIDLVLIIVGEFLACHDIPDRYNPDRVAELFRVTVWVTRMIDSAVVFWRIPNELSSRHGWLLLGE